jgi:hypothetical protein
VCNAYSVLTKCDYGDEPDKISGQWGYYSDYIGSTCYTNSCCGLYYDCCNARMPSDVPSMSPSRVPSASPSMVPSASPTDVVIVRSSSMTSIQSIMIGIECGFFSVYSWVVWLFTFSS